MTGLDTLKSEQKCLKAGYILRRLASSLLRGILRADTAHQECKSMNNFSSASAIVNALVSPKVAMLVLACESRATQIIHTLNRDLAPMTGAYFDTLRHAGTKELIPWLGMVGLLRMSSRTSPRLSQIPTCPFSIQPLPTPILLLRWMDII